jgi:hypothetical protein
MICILSINSEREITGWIIATDMRDAFRQASGAAIGESEESSAVQLATWLVSKTETVPKAGKVVLPSGHIMLVT